MIARVWRSAIRPEDSAEYLEYLQVTGLAAFRATPGNRGGFVFQRLREGRAELVMMSLWDSWEAVRRFAGPRPEKAVYFPEDRRFLLEMPEEVEHWEVLAGGPEE